MYPADVDDPVLLKCIHPLHREDFIRLVLAVEVTRELIRRREQISLADALVRVFESSVWGGVHLPEVTGVAGEDLDVELQRMLLVTRSLKVAGTCKLGSRARVKQEIDNEAVFDPSTDWLTCINDNGREVFIIE